MKKHLVYFWRGIKAIVPYSLTLIISITLMSLFFYWLEEGKYIEKSFIIVASILVIAIVYTVGILVITGEDEHLK